MKKAFLICTFFLCFIGCKKEQPSVKKNIPPTLTQIKYAKGFNIVTENGKRYLVLKRVFQDATKGFKFELSDKNDIAKNKLKVPVEKLVVTSTTHVPMVELLGSEHAIVGFPNTKYVSSKKTRALIDNGTITELGSEQSMNTEILLDLDPELIVGFALHPNNKLYNNIKKTGIPVVFDGDWLEETPLGRAEWIKFFGVLLGKEKEADSIFNTIAKNYNEAKQIAQKSTAKPTILSGSLFKDVWYVPAGKSFTAQYFADANLDYLWKETEGAGSLQLSFESVLDKGQTADYWIGCGLYTTREQMINTNKHYNKFTPFTKDKIYTNSLVKGATGGIEYFEFAPVRPDLVLKDLIKITNPELLKDYKLRFFSLVE